MGNHNKREIRWNLVWGLVLALITIVIGCFFAAHRAEGQEITLSWENRYLDFNSEVLHDDPVGRLKYYQSLSDEGCWYLYAEALSDGNGWGNSFGDEAGLYPGCYLQSEETGWFADVALGYIAVSDPNDEGMPDFVNPFIELGRVVDWGERGTLSVSVVAEGYYPTDDDALNMGHGWFYRLRSRRDIPLGEHFQTSIGLEGAYDDGVYGLDEAYLAFADISIMLNLGEHWSLGPGFRRSWTLSDVDDYRTDESVYMFSLSYSR
ncbi:MAG: hypothetical protein AMXMBFR44_6400 [Candidatus Campbellbacteria bacterium]